MDKKIDEILKNGSIRLEVKRSGMLQKMLFTVKRIKIGEHEFVELYLPRHLELSEMQRVAEETGLPVETDNGRAFPKGKGAVDFMGL
ncbi:MAG: hypothetical protein M1544_02120 [Candidatus Marsarchaeota archaeon]|nr:hypothetical protein [Candidatus Marsarchaeota archaeon]